MSGSVQRVAVFGAGIAGLTAAHELSQRGYSVSVYESLDEAGGFFRSDRSRKTANMPGEYSWHGMGPWYHNTFDVLRQIPLDGAGSVYDRALSRPIDFGIFPDRGRAQFYDHRFRHVPRMFAFSRSDFVRWFWLMLKAWTAHERSLRHYAALNGARVFQPLLGERGYLLWRSCFGPWIGSDWTNVSLHTVGHFFRKQLLSDTTHLHAADDEGPAWSHGAGDGWLLLRGPSSEIWFAPWVKHLRQRGVQFFWNNGLHELAMERGRIAHARLASGAHVVADHYIVAANPFAVADILARTPDLEQQAELWKFRPLVQDGPHVQVSFRIAWTERIRFPRPRTAVVLGDTEFNLTLFAQEQAWRPEVDLGREVGSLWTATSCVSNVPGRLFGLPVSRCTREQFIAEVKAQVLGCAALDSLVREANGGRALTNFQILRIEVWHEWRFSSDGIAGPDPKWVTTTHTQPFIPDQVTGLPNLFLAGAHTRTEADVWSIESAVESGRRAARAIDPSVPVLSQYRPPVLRRIARIDDLCFRLGAPHVLDLALVALLAGAIAALVLLLQSCT